MVYSLILNITVTVEKTHKSEWAMGQNIAKNIWQSSVWAVLAKKYWKCESNTFILPHKREYGLQPYLEYNRNCWENTQSTMTNGLKYRKEHLTVFDLSRVNKKKVLNMQEYYFHFATQARIRSTGAWRFLRVAETVEKTRKPKCAGAKISQRTCSCFLFYLN